LLGLVLGYLMEINLRRALQISNGDWGYLLSSPISIGLWVLAAISLFAPSILTRIRKQGGLDSSEL
jgi:putative tricarboxylic transport membrane protein